MTQNLFSQLFCYSANTTVSQPTLVLFSQHYKHSSKHPPGETNAVGGGLRLSGQVQFSTVQSSAVQYSEVECNAVQYSAVQYSEVECSAVQCSTVQCLGQIFCDLETHLHTFFGFSAACCKVTFQIFYGEEWTSQDYENPKSLI